MDGVSGEAARCKRWPDPALLTEFFRLYRCGDPAPVPNGGLNKSMNLINSHFLNTTQCLMVANRWPKQATLRPLSGTARWPV